MKKYITLGLFALLLSASLHAQQDVNYTLYRYNMNLINPAAAGLEGGSKLSLISRSQWFGIVGAPNTMTLNYNRQAKNKLGYALSIMRDEVFVLQETDMALDLSYHLNINETTKLYFGMKGGGSYVNIDLTKAGALDNDQLFMQNDSFFNVHIGSGLYLQNERFYVSVSTPNFLNGTRYDKQGNAPQAAIENMHWYAGGGYHFEVNETLSLTPSFMLRYVEGAPNSWDTGLHAQTSRVGYGVNYRIEEYVSVYGMLQIDQRFEAGLAYDFMTNQVNEVNKNGSIEFLLQYRF